MAGERQQAEIDRMKKELHEGSLLFQKIELTMDSMEQAQTEILEQVKKTNGRVTKLEKFQRAVMWLSTGAVLAASSNQLGFTKILLALLP
jgi:hypothetical protein